MANGPTITENREAARIAEGLIPEHHTELSDAKIRYLSTSAKPPKRKGCKQFGAVAVLGPVPRFLSSESGDMEDGADVVIVVRSKTWTFFNDDQRRAAVDHLLAHVQADYDEETGELLGWVIVGHSVEEFTDVLGRNGAWNLDLREFGLAGQQLAMDLDADDGADTAADAEEAELAGVGV
jgi:hypothetical protein